MAAECGQLTADARHAVAALLGTDADSVVWGPSATQLISNLSRSVIAGLDDGDEIVCTELDHEANVAPWQLAASDSGVEVRIARLTPESGRLDTEAIAAVLSPRTRWVAVTGASNVLGTIPDLPAISELAHSVGARVLVDGVHLTPHKPIDVAGIGCDVFVTSAYKWFGPHVSAMVASSDLIDSLEIQTLREAPTTGPQSFELGTTPFELLVGVKAAAEFITEVGAQRLAEHESTVFAPLLEGLQSMERVTTFGPSSLLDRTPTVLFTVDGIGPAEVASRLAERSIAVWSGHNYGVCAVEALGLLHAGGGVRAGVSPYTSPYDVDRLLTAVAELA